MSSLYEMSLWGEDIMTEWTLAVTVAGVIGAACVAGEFEQAAVRAFDAAVHPGDRRQLILIFQSCLFKSRKNACC